MGAINLDRGWLNKVPDSRVPRCLSSLKKWLKQENGVGDHSYHSKEKLLFFLLLNLVSWESISRCTDATRISENFCLTAYIYGLFRQRDIYLLAQASNLSHSVCNGSSVTQKLSGLRQSLCVAPWGQGGYFNRPTEKHVLVASSRAGARSAAAPPPRWAALPYAGSWAPQAALSATK